MEDNLEARVYWPPSPPWRYKLMYGRLPARTWSLGIVEGDSVDLKQTREQPGVVSTEALQAWLEPLTFDAAARSMVARMAGTHPERFDASSD
jgi:hypothetical protein